MFGDERSFRRRNGFRLHAGWTMSANGLFGSIICPVVRRQAALRPFQTFADFQVGIIEFHTQILSHGSGYRSSRTSDGAAGPTVGELPSDNEVVALWPGAVLPMSFDMVELLRKKGLKGRQLFDGMPKWRLVGLPLRDCRLVPGQSNLRANLLSETGPAEFDIGARQRNRSAPKYSTCSGPRPPQVPLL